MCLIDLIGCSEHAGGGGHMFGHESVAVVGRSRQLSVLPWPPHRQTQDSSGRSLPLQLRH